MAKYTLTRTLDSGEVLKVEQANAWDEAYKLLDKGEAEIKRLKAETIRLAEEAEANKAEEPTPEPSAEGATETTPEYPPEDKVPTEDTIQD